MSTVGSALPTAVACLAIPSLALECELAERPALRDRPVALASEDGMRAEDATPSARAYGVRPGMPLRAAVALCPSLVVLEARPAHVARLAESLVAAMEVVSPLVEEAAPGVVFADLRGTQSIFPRPKMIVRAVFDAVPGALAPRLGLAGQRFTAYAAALQAVPRTEAGAEQDATKHAKHVERGEEAHFLAPLPVDLLAVDWLGLDAEAVERMRLLGLRACGDLAALPRHAVEAQFGIPGGRAWLAARGEDAEPVHPRPWERQRVVESVQAEPPLVSRESVTLAVEQLLGRALRHPRATRRCVRFVRLRAESERGGLWERTKVTNEPTGDRARLWLLLRSLIEYAEFPGPLSRVELELGGLTAENGRQQSLFDAEHARRREQLDDMVRHLKVRFGHSPVARIVAVEPWHRLPERRYALLDYDP